MIQGCWCLLGRSWCWRDRPSSSFGLACKHSQSQIGPFVQPFSKSLSHWAGLCFGSYISIMSGQFRREIFYDSIVGFAAKKQKARPCPFIQTLSRFYPILSWFYPYFILILPWIYLDFILILSRFFKNSLYPNFILILS